MSKPRKLQAYADNAEQTARAEQAIQKEVDRADKHAGQQHEKSRTMQAGARAYPDPVSGAASCEARARGAISNSHRCTRPRLQGLRQAARHGRAHHRRQIPASAARWRSYMRARVPTSRSPISMSTGMPKKPSARSRTRGAAASSICRRRRRSRVLPGKRWSKPSRAFGKLDILVNNAAFQEHANDIEDLTEEHFDRTIKTNLYGYFYMAKAAVPQ